MRIRTGYSFKSATGHLAEVAAHIKSLGWKSAPISDRCSTFGFNKWTKICKKNDLKPIYGVEIAVVRTLGEKKPTADYWTFFAINGISCVNDIVNAATANPGKEPSLTYEQALSFPGVITIAGERCFLDLVKPRENFFIGLSPSISKGQFVAAKKAGHRFLLTSDNVYTTTQDREFYRIALGSRSFTQTYPQHIATDDEIAKCLGWFVSQVDFINALNNRNHAMSLCDAKLVSATMLVPERKKTLRKMCEEGAKRLGVSLKDTTYKARLDRELEMIASKQFEDYFYIIADMITWAKKRMIVGPARGSSCGSLVCYLLDITTIDPLKFDLIFERFIDVNRSDLPDIDIDFSDVRREQVFNYVEQKYGSERVARLGTVGMFKPKSALNQAGMELAIPKWRVEKLTDSIVQRSSGDARALQAIEDTLRDTEVGRSILEDYPAIKIAGRLEGHPANASQHAAGIVITQDPINRYIAVDARTSSLMCDKKDAEDLGMLKIDALGLTQLSVFERTLQLLGIKDVSGWLEKLPLDDPKAFEVLNKRQFAGIFQFMGGALQSLSKQIEVNHLEDIVAITALARPGPMATGGAMTWVHARTGKKPVAYPHPLFEAQLKGTLGVVMYQEQVMQIGREIGDLSWNDVTELRKAMSKSLGKEYFDKFGDRWKAAAAKKGIEKHVLDKVWDDLCAYGSWAFNRSHAVAYGHVSYWCCWLKAHHPVEFAAATLDAESDPTKQIKLLRELADEGVGYVPVDAEMSIDRWNVGERDCRKFLVGPLQSIKGIGPAAVNEILTNRKRGLPIRASLAKKLANGQTELDTLFPVRDRVAAICPDLRSLNITSKPWRVADVQCDDNREVMIIGVARKVAPKDENEEVNVAKRGYKLDGQTRAVNLFFYDDTDEIFCKISRFNFLKLGVPLLEQARAGKSIYAIKGTTNPSFRMISVKAVRYIGEMK